MRILVIGSKGFIGSHLVDYLNDRHEVWQCDVVTDYISERYIQIGVYNSDYYSLFEKHHFDVCVNCSGAASVPDSYNDPLRDFTLNVSNVYLMLNAIFQHNKECRFINMSSAAVYGNPQVLPIIENSEMLPMSPYGMHKKMAESILLEFAKEFGIKTCSLRVFSAFGNGLRKQIFWDTDRKMDSGNVASFWGTGEESRDFIHVNDIAQAVDLVIRNADFNGEAVNVANGVQTTIRDAVVLYAKLKGYEGRIEFCGTKREGDPLFWQADISKLQSWGYKQSVSLEQGLKDYVAWIKENG